VKLQFATNHLGHFALARALHDALAHGAKDRGAARIVSLSSTAHMRAPVDFADIESLDAAEAVGVLTYKTTGQGAATTLVAAVAPELEQTGGHYLDDCREACTVPNDADLSAHSHGVKEWALDPDAACELWAVSLKPAATTSQVTASIYDFAGSLGDRPNARLV
jgi:hypothetical protein